MSISIRTGTPADAEALAELAARTFRDTFGSDNRPEDLALYLTQAYGPVQQGRELADPDITTLLAGTGHAPGAYAQLRRGHAPDCVSGESPLELWRFYVAREWHGRGLAQALMRRVEAEAERCGARTLWLGVWERNERALAFYRKCGFTDVGSHIFMVGSDPQTDRVMERSLSPTYRRGAEPPDPGRHAERRGEGL